MRAAGLIFLVFGLIAEPALAAVAEECPPPTGLAEPLRCGDAELAALEARVAAELAAASAKLSGAGRARLRDDQAEWRNMLASLCPAPPAEQDEAHTVECLKQEYDLRRDRLSRAVEIAGNVTFLRAERFAVRPAQNPDEADRPVRLDIAWPVLDRAAGRQKRWNEAMAEQAESLAQPLDKAAPDTDVLVGYRIDSVLPGLIQTVFTRDLYIHGAAHGDASQVSALFLLQQSRPLEAADLFDPAKAWRSALARAAFERLQAASGSGGWTLWPKEPEELGSLVADPARWLIAKDGLRLHFDAYDLADYAAGPQEVTIPWSEVLPLVKPGPAVRLPP